MMYSQNIGIEIWDIPATLFHAVPPLKTTKCGPAMDPPSTEPSAIKERGLSNAVSCAVGCCSGWLACRSGTGCVVVVSDALPMVCVQGGRGSHMPA